MSNPDKQWMYGEDEYREKEMSVPFLHHRSYYCQECGCALRHDPVETEFGRRMTLLHDRFDGCKYSLKRFRVPTVVLDEFTDQIITDEIQPCRNS